MRLLLLLGLITFLVSYFRKFLLQKGIGLKDIPVIEPKDLRSSLSRPGHVLIDLRNKLEYKSKHIAGSQNIPFANLKAHQHNLPTDKTIILICNNQVKSIEAYRNLSGNGFLQMKILKGGLDYWKKLGYSFDK